MSTTLRILSRAEKAEKINRANNVALARTERRLRQRRIIVDTRTLRLVAHPMVLSIIAGETRKMTFPVLDNWEFNSKIEPALRRIYAHNHMQMNLESS